ncbi:hypothetical protein F4X73_12775 [Candidatus Poribacteria bacterium]|nr:hypothetical protein [Candidatus Poribacteria bacterium]MYB65557.1 hypothetical protein [Candidatus Poribacteria bacterium]
MAKSMADVLREEGIKRGREEGKAQAKRENIIKLLQIRFENVPETVTQKVKRIRSLSRLNSLFEKAASIDSLDDFDE